MSIELVKAIMKIANDYRDGMYYFGELETEIRKALDALPKC